MGVEAIADVDIGGEGEFPYFLIHVKLFCYKYYSLSGLVHRCKTVEVVN